MRKPLRIVTFWMSLLVTFSAAMHALCESDYVTIAELRESLPERWVGEYVVQNGAYKQLEKGDTVSVDVPIVVPEVDAVPAVRITWEPPIEGLDESFYISKNEWYSKTIGRNFPMDEMGFPVMEEKTTFDPELPWEDAPAIAIEEFRKYFPMMRDKELTCYFHYSYGESEDNGFQCLYFYTTYHGIPHLLSNRSFLHVIESEIGPNDLIDPPGNVAMRIKRPGQFWVNIDTSKEIGVEIEDIPLLPFEEILKAFERQVEAGHAYSLNEVRFGYMTFIDPEKRERNSCCCRFGRPRGERAEILPFPST